MRACRHELVAPAGDPATPGKSVTAAPTDIPGRHEGAPAAPTPAEPLALECARLHQALFGRPANDPSVPADYIQVLSRRPPSPADMAVRRIVGRQLSVTAIEFYWRLRRGRNSLTQRLEVLAAICEARPEYWNDFTSTGVGRARALCKLAMLPLRATALAAAGWWQSLRHGIRF